MSVNKGFTLLEVLVVVGIMGLIAAMVWPMLGTLDDAQRHRITMEKMDAIEDALLGPEQGELGGYVGDMCRPEVPEDLCGWPGLWKPGSVQTGNDGMDDQRGAFSQDRFRWEKPFVPVANTEQESLGQPRGLWTRYLSGQDDVDTLPEEHWRGPYLRAPVTENPDLGGHYASSQSEYEQLDQFPGDRKAFHLLQGQDQLTDGWDRAFRFFISGDDFWMISLKSKHRDLAQDFDITDYNNCDDLEDEGYICRRLNPAKGLQVDDPDVWTSVRRHIKQQILGADNPEQLIARTREKIDRVAAALVGDAPSGPNTGYTGDMLEWPDLWNYVCRFDRGEPGESDPVPCNVCRDGEGEIGYVGETECVEYPDGEWEQALGGNSYTYGQPRGLWDQGDHDDSEFGVGWRHRYHPKPGGNSADPDPGSEAEVLQDAWEQPLHFFKVADNGKTHLMVVSAGESGSGVFHNSGEDFVFPQPEFAGDPDPVSSTEFNDYLEKRTETFDLADYQPDFQGEIDGTTYDNTDNIVRLVRQEDWQPGFMDLEVSLDADLSGESEDDCNNHVHESNDYTCRVYGLDGSPVFAEESFETRWDSDNSVCELESLEFTFNENTTAVLISGGRYLVCWDSSGGDPPEVTTDWNRIFSVFANPARILDREILLKDSDF